MRIKLKTKLLVLALGSIFVSLGAALSPLILIFQNAQRGAALEGQMQIAGAAAEEISHFLDTQFLLLNEAVSLMSSGLAEDDAFRKAFMQRLLFRNDAFFDIALVDRDGNELIRENRYRIIKSSELVNRSQSLEFQSTKEHGYYSGLLYFEGGRPLFRLGRANKDANGKLVSMVIAEVDARIMQDVVRRTSIARAGGRAFIVDHNGIVIAHPVFSQVLAQKNFSFLPIVDALSAHQSFSSIYQNETGEKVLGAWADIMGRADGEDTATGWHIVAEENISYAMRHVDKALRFGLASLFFGFTLTFVGVWFLSRQIVRPLEMVHKAVAQFGQGKLSERVFVRTSDEMKDLAEGFNQMAESLGTSILTLGKNRHVIAEERSKVVALVESLNVGVMLISPEGKIDLANAAAREFLQLPSSLLSQNLAQLLEEMKNVTANGKDMQTAEIRFRSPRDIYLRVTKIEGKKLKEGSAFDGALYVMEDLTKEKQIQEQEHFVSEMKSNFVTVAAHQMRTPLSAIKWLLEMILDGDAGKLTARHKEYAQKIQQSNERMVRLISDLLDLSRIEEGRFGYKFAKVEIAGLIEKVVETLLKTAEQYHVSLSFESPSEKLPMVRGDGEKLKIVLENLIQNAVAYTPKGGHVRVKTWQDKENLMVSVEDTGIGIPKEEQKKLFAKFFRGQQAIKMRTDGAGLGLAITKDIVKEHGGKIWFESLPGNGTTFFLSLPISF